MNRSHSWPSWWQNVPAGAGTSPAVWAAFHIVASKKSTIPTLTPPPLKPAVCHAAALVLAISCPVASSAASPPGATGSIDNGSLASSGTRTVPIPGRCSSSTSWSYGTQASIRLVPASPVTSPSASATAASARSRPPA